MIECFCADTILSQEVALKNKFLSASVAALLIAATSLGFAGGYQINEHGARAMGMGGAFVALASDASAVFFNPAGLAYQRGVNVLLGGTFIMPSTAFTSATPVRPEAKMNSQTFFPPNAYFTYNMDDVTLGLGVFAPYGLGTEWQPAWDGRYSAVKTDLQALYINPSIGYRINDQWSIGAGVSFITGTATLNRKTRTFSSLVGPVPSASDGDITLDGTGSGFGFNLGVLYKPTKEFSIGVSYRSLAKVKYEGDAKFTNMQALTTWFPGGTGSVEIPMPTNLQGGLAYQVTPEFMISADLQFVGWSSFEKLTITLPNGPNGPGGALGTAPLQKTQVEIENWKDSFIYRLGAEYTMESFTLRAGFIYDGTPQITPSVEPRLPDANRTEFTLGAGFMLTDNVNVDVAYQFISSADRTGSFSDYLGTTLLAKYTGTYTSTANLIGLNVGLAF